MAIKVHYNPSTGKVSYNPIIGKVQVVNVPDLPCPVCWGPEGILGSADDLPDSITVTVEGITTTANWLPIHGPAVTGEFILVQRSCYNPTNDNGCFWSYHPEDGARCGAGDDDTSIQVVMSISWGLEVVVGNENNFTCFLGEDNSPCQLLYENNELDSNPHAIFNGGTITIEV